MFSVTKKLSYFQQSFIFFGIRILISMYFFYGYFFSKTIIDDFLSFNLKSPLTIIIYLYMLYEIIRRFTKYNNVAISKYQKNKYIKRDYTKKKLDKYIKNMNHKALIIMLIWLFFNVVFLIIYKLSYISKYELVALAFFYYVLDYVCVIFWCPFQTFMKNKCCVTCRIYNWDKFFYTMPLMLLPHLSTFILFFLSLVLIIIWEFSIVLHPERFYEGSNSALTCKDCNNKTCTIKQKKKNIL